MMRAVAAAVILSGLCLNAQVSAERNSSCRRLSPGDTLILHGKRQHAERFVECITGHWPNVDEVYRKIGR
jgi:hypothetical protein